MKTTTQSFSTSAPVSKKHGQWRGFFVLCVSLTFLLPGTSLAQPGISISPTSLSFGNVAVGSSGVQMLTISNPGTGTLSVGTITSINPVFVASPTNLTVAAGAVRTVTVTFTPTSAGSHTGTLTIPHNAPGVPAPENAAGNSITISLSGTAGPAILLSTSSLSFGGINIGSSAARMFTISNPGTAALSVSSISSSNPQFTVSPASFTVVAQIGTITASQTVTVTFTPTSTGSQTGTLTISHNAVGNPSTVSLFGVGVDSIVPDLRIAAKIAFTSDNAIYTINTNGTGLTRLTSPLSSVLEYVSSWSPDGSKIAFTVGGSPVNGIYVMNADGTNRSRFPNISTLDQEPSWSPDGTKIIFQSQHGGFEIYTMNADGTSQTQLTTGWSYEPSWSPDGTKIALVSRRDNNDEIYVT